MKPGDEIRFNGVRYTLVERRFIEPGQVPMWLVVETTGDTFPRLLIEVDVIKAVHEAAMS